MNTNSITGRFMEAFPVKSVGKSGFKVQAIKIDNSTSPDFASTPEFQLTGNYIGMADGLRRGQEVTVYFTVQGRHWEKDGRSGIMTSLQAYRIEQVERTSLKAAVQSVPKEPVGEPPVAGSSTSATGFKLPDDEAGDLPF
ncbi:DUF3127 domain-containing protein [Fibrella aquatilis]|uniref:DUF3127 domain-containing protein n=1 Tax=Fibrella aquatilis TaxID=2817059 RepID=A0A939GCK1_9BACT|nr:DUF3127 domain-containing protein [Fibrella aquatilis]MBO0933903.1 DUF3127 domain-containing protein [Fibrella aquatilis]